MELMLKNIGIVQQAIIKLDGLTVITGHNNSGKTTVGKTLFSLVSATENFQYEFLTDMKKYVRVNLSKIIERFIPDAPFIIIEEEDDVVKYKWLTKLINNSDLNMNSMVLAQLIDLIHDIEKEIKTISKDEYNREFAFLLADESQEQFDFLKEQALAELQILENNVMFNAQNATYTTAKVIKTLKKEFNDQILPLKRNKDTQALIKLYAIEKDFYNVSINSNQEAMEDRVFFAQAFDSAVFIDDVHILDSLTGYEQNRKRTQNYTTANEINWDNIISSSDHKYKLIEKLTDKTDNIIEDVVNKKYYEAVMKMINELFDEEISIQDGKFVCSESKLDIRNLATGSKMFVMIKLLLEKGHIDKDVLLILDEPESHLHPEWQNKFAEIMVIMSKMSGVTILLTTHSPNFLMALEAYSNKYDYLDKTNFYMTEKGQEDVGVIYKDVKNNMQKAYSKLSEPLFYIKMLKDEVFKEQKE